MSIRTKFFIVLTPLLAAICVLIFIFAPYEYKKQALQALAERSKSIAEMTAYSLSPALFFNDTETINEVFLSARQNRDLVYIIVLNSAGRAVAAYNKEKADQANFTKAADSSVSPDGNLFYSKSAVFYKNSKLGELYIGLSLEELHKEMKRIQKNILFTSFIIFCAGTLAIFGLSTVITRPLGRMTRAAKQIADGDLARRAEISSRDEVGQLAKSFNAMIDHLQTSYGQLEQAKLTLEKRVEERTRELQNEVTDRKRAEEELQKAYGKLTLFVEQLEQRNRERTLLSELGDSFQTCNTEKEVFTVSAQFAKRLFGDKSGVLYVHKALKGLLEPVVTWGGFKPHKDFLELDECWALRRGKLHHVEGLESDLICPHLEISDRSSLHYLCTPLSAHGEILGLFHIRCPQVSLSDKQSLSQEEKQQACAFVEQLALTFAERVAMTLSNLRLRETLREQSIRDPLTGLFNRRFMEESLEREIYRALRSGNSLGIIMLDIDFFKQFNEVFGHEAGDVMLQAIGQFLQTNVRKGDVACRYGGEEFTLILPGASLNVAKERAEFLLGEIKNLKIFYANTTLGGISLSFGVSMFPDHGSTVAALLKAADTALLRAKKDGRSRVVVYGG